MTYGVNAPLGFQIANTGGGFTWTGQFNRYQINTTASSSMFTGDPVSLATDGTVIRALATTSVLGVFMGCEYFPSTNQYAISFPFWPGGAGGPAQVSNTTPWAFVADDPMTQFTIQETDGSGASGTPLSNTSVSNNGNFLYTAGNTTTGLSKCSLNNASFATTLTQNCKLVRLDTTITGGVIAAGTPGTSGVQGTGAFSNWIVQFNNDVYKAGSTRP